MSGGGPRSRVRSWMDVEVETSGSPAPQTMNSPFRYVNKTLQSKELIRLIHFVPAMQRYCCSSVPLGAHSQRETPPHQALSRRRQHRTMESVSQCYYLSTSSPPIPSWFSRSRFDNVVGLDSSSQQDVPFCRHFVRNLLTTWYSALRDFVTCHISLSNDNRH